MPREEYELIRDAVKQHLSFFFAGVWMWKMIQFGYVYGKREERARRKKKDNPSQPSKHSGLS